MKKSVFSLSRFLLNIAFLMAIFGISNSCTKIANDSPSTPPPPPPAKVDVHVGYSFSPSEITVQPGTLVTWENRGPDPQSVTSEDGLFEGIIGPNETYSYKFSSAGAYSYYNRIHPNSTGIVIVN